MSSLLSIVSIIVTYWSTNLQNRNKIINSIFLHEENTVCPFGIFMGKIYSLILISQLILLKINKYKKFKNFYIIIGIIGLILSLLNFNVFKKIIIVFVIQLIIYNKN